MCYSYGLIYLFSTASAELCVKKSKKVDSTNDEWALAVPKQDIRGMLRHYRDLRDRTFGFTVVPLKPGRHLFYLSFSHSENLLLSLGWS